MIDVASAETVGDDVALCTLNKIIDLFGITRKTVSIWRKEGREGVPEKVGDKVETLKMGVLQVEQLQVVEVQQQLKPILHHQ